MVDVAQVPQVGDLLNEHRSIKAALDNLEQGGRIVAMRIAPPPRQEPEDTTGLPFAPPPMGMEVPTADIDYPAQMVSSIKTALGARRDALRKELAALGVTGLE